MMSIKCFGISSILGMLIGASTVYAQVDARVPNVDIEDYLEQGFLSDISNLPEVDGDSYINSVEDWFAFDETAAPFIGEWQGEDNLSIYIYPSERSAQVCVLMTNNDYIGFNEGRVGDDGRLNTREEFFSGGEDASTFEYLSSDIFFLVDNYLTWGYYVPDRGSRFFPMTFVGLPQDPSSILPSGNVGERILRRFYAAGCRISPLEPMVVDLPENPTDLDLSASETIDGITIRVDGGKQLNSLTFDAYIVIENNSDRPFAFLPDAVCIRFPECNPDAADPVVVQNAAGQTFTSRYEPDVSGNTVQPGGVITATLWVDHPWETLSEESLSLMIRARVVAGPILEFELPLIEE